MSRRFNDARAAGLILLSLLALSAAPPARAQAPSPAAFSAVPSPGVADAAPPRVQIKAKNSTLLSSNMDGRIDVLALRDGDSFSKDQVLARMACAGPESQLAKARATLEKRRKTFEANQSLHAMKSLSTLELEVSRAEVREAEAESQVMQALAERCTVRAPFSGRVAGLQVRPHQAVREGQPLMEILDDSELELELIVPSRWLAWLKVGSPFTVEVDETIRQYKAEVARLSGAVDPVSQSIKVYGKLLGDRQGLLPGMSGQALFQPPR